MPALQKNEQCRGPAVNASCVRLSQCLIYSPQSIFANFLRVIFNYVRPTLSRVSSSASVLQLLRSPSSFSPCIARPNRSPLIRSFRKSHGRPRRTSDAAIVPFNKTNSISYWRQYFAFKCDSNHCSICLVIGQPTHCVHNIFTQVVQSYIFRIIAPCLMYYVCSNRPGRLVDRTGILLIILILYNNTIIRNLRLKCT